GARAGPAAGAAPPPPLQRRLRVLVAEDTPANQLVARSMLEKMGHRVQVVADGEEAVTAATTGSFDLVLMDVQMPNVDGYEATRRLRAAGGAAAQLPIVALTAFAQLLDRDKALATGMNDYLAKPFRFAELAAAIERVMAGRPDAPAQPDTDAEGRPEIEADVLAELRGAVGDERFQRLCRQFADDARQSLTTINSGLAEGDITAIRRSAHTLAGLFGQFGAVSAAEAARRVEAAADGDVPGCAAALSARADVALCAVCRWGQTATPESGVADRAEA
ncbi:response regulator, partial [Rhodoplanes tepidamans]